MGWINEQIDKLQEMWPPNRLVALLTPFLVGVAGWIAAWLAENMPGLPPLDEGWIAASFVAGALSALTMAYKWIDGWQKHEARAEAELDPVAALSDVREEAHETDYDPDIEEKQLPEEPG